MPSLTAFVFMVGWTVVGAGLLNVTGIWEWAPRKVQTVTVVRSDVEALVDRLKPLTKDPSTNYFGVSVEFSGAGVSIAMHLRDDSQLRSKAATLEGAVKGLAAPNTAVQAALAGWNLPR